MMYPYYPGCSLHSTAREYDISLKAVSDALGIELKEIKKWICCGASAAHQSSPMLAISLPAKNLAEVEKENMGEVLVPCAACYARFKTTKFELEKDPALLQDINEIISYPFKNEVKILHPLEILSNGMSSKIRRKVKKDLSKLRVVCYYGCLLTRPPKVMQFDICEYPVSMDLIMKNAGVEVLDWSYKTSCCGAALSLTKTEIILKLIDDILGNAIEVGADAIVVACPLCHSNLDMRQDEANKLFNREKALPIFYFTQVLGLAFGLKPEELSLNTHLVETDELLRKID
jgi:heterodisulfide reductase subunit B